MFSVGQRHIALAKAWFPTLATFGTAGTLASLYLLDWKLVNQYIPFYNTKFKEVESD